MYLRDEGNTQKNNQRESVKMNYTKAVLEDVQGNIEVNLDKDGNKYLVGLRHTETGEYTHKTFDTIEQAYEVFEKFSKAIVMGTHSYEQRKGFLK